MARAGIKGYNILLTGDMKILIDDSEATKGKGVTSKLKLLNKTSYNELILSQEETVSFQIFDEEK